MVAEPLGDAMQLIRMEYAELPGQARASSNASRAHQK